MARPTARSIARLLYIAGCTSLAVVIALCALIFVPDLRSEPSGPNRATYLGLIASLLGLALALIGPALGLRRRVSPVQQFQELHWNQTNDLSVRLQSLRMGDNISVIFRCAMDGREMSIEELATAAMAPGARTVLLGAPGGGKTFATLQLAVIGLRLGHESLPVVVPLSRWNPRLNPNEWLRDFLCEEYSLSARTAEELISTGKLLPIFDGLDELPGPREHLFRFLDDLLHWQTGLEGNARFLVTCRSRHWAKLPATVRHHPSLFVYRIRPVSESAIQEYLSRSLLIPKGLSFEKDYMPVLRARFGPSLGTPWRLAVIAAALGKPSPGAGPGKLVFPADVSTLDDMLLMETFVNRVALDGSPALKRAIRSCELSWLSGYARYLKRNDAEHRVVAGQPLSSRDLTLHRLWPIAGEVKPRLCDLIIAALCSVPGFYWLADFLWPRGFWARVCYVLALTVWTAMLCRTSTQAWVRPAMVDWSRLRRPAHLLRQTLAALAVGAVAAVIVDPFVGAICFVTSWLAIGLSVGFGQTLTTDEQAHVVGPYGVLRREHFVSRLSAWVVFPAIAAGFGASWGIAGFAAAILYCLVVGETVGSALWRRYLAMYLSAPMSLPPAPNRLLSSMAKLGFVRAAGLSYQFRHDDVRDYFAQRR